VADTCDLGTSENNFMEEISSGAWKMIWNTWK
jgi:hypothetical protein